MYIRALSVTQVNEYIKRILSTDAILSNITIKGEISNFKHHYSGHMYFTLKDDNSKIKCVMFKSSCSNLKFYPEDGMNVIVTGSVSVYERDGQYQVYVNDMQPDGVGALYIAFEQLKKKLELEGLFSPEHKKAIPKFPSKIGVITSSTGAAVRDIINVTTRRYPGIDLLIVPVLVQGEEAPGEICDAIEQLNKKNDIDVIIVGRGGGSIEELWAFNEECVARAIYNSKIPIISAVGHETDFTIADFVSDLRAPTPSAGAELSVPDKRELTYKFNNLLDTIIKSTLSEVDSRKKRLRNINEVLCSLSPVSIININKQYLDALNSKMESSMKHSIDLYREMLKKCTSNLESLNPLSVISRGYCVSYISGTKKVVDDIGKVKIGDNIDVQLKNGILKCSVHDVLKGDVEIEEGKK